MHLTCGDVPTAYLQAKLHDVIVYSEQPPGFEEPGPNGEPTGEMVCRWDSALYGFVPSCYEWGEEFHDFIVTYGFVACCSDRKVFILHRDGDVLIVTLHVDDLLMACSGDGGLRDDFMRQNPYRIKDLGAARRIIGGNIAQDVEAGTVSLSLSTYIDAAARRFRITDVGNCDMPASQKLLDDCIAARPTEREIDEVQTEYYQIGGSILFIATFARPDVAFHAHFISQHFVHCGYAHLRFARRVLGYLLKTMHMGLTYRRSVTFEAVGVFKPEEAGQSGVDGRPHAVSDANFGVSRSKSGVLFMLASAAVLWRVIVQRSPAISPAEAEFYGLTTTIAESIHVRQLLEELGVVFEAATQVFCDSKAARLLAVQGASSSRTRHIHRRWHFAVYHANDGSIHVTALRGSRNPANVLTKLTTGAMFIRERAYVLGMRTSNS